MKYSGKQTDTLLSLPQHLQTTYRAIISLSKASANQTAQVTGKARAVESAYLNQLVTMKILKKHREGRTAIFQEIMT